MRWENLTENSRADNLINSELILFHLEIELEEDPLYNCFNINCTWTYIMSFKWQKMAVLQALYNLF